ncbi:MAG: hypothetical protein HY680_00130 [Chloroflexi bacterium]|nr:hypothetical protein [Chloroflexota bacterium]
MVKRFRELAQRLPRLKPWVGIAVALAIALLGYYAFSGYRYINASSETTSLATQADQLSRRLRQKVPDEATLAMELERQQRRPRELIALFSYPQKDDLVAIVLATATDTSVTLERIALGEVAPRTDGTIQYQTQAMALGLRGQLGDVSRFLTLLQQRVPGTSLSGLSVSGTDKAPTAAVQLLFYLDPQPVVQAPPKATAKKAPTPKAGK